VTSRRALDEARELARDLLNNIELNGLDLREIALRASRLARFMEDDETNALPCW
jgi:hypothetical protein